MRHWLCIICGSYILSFVSAQQSFVGKIEFLYYQTIDSTKNVYTIKNKLVRLDQYSKKKDGSIEGRFLLDLNKNEIKIISPKRKIWNIHHSKITPIIKGECHVTRTGHTKKIAGMECVEYIVTNQYEDTEITYWICEKGHFDFFIPMLQLWNRKDKISVYFNQIKNLPAGSMPMLAIEKKISTGTIMTKIETIQVHTEKIDDSVFIIPKDYKKFEEE